MESKFLEWLFNQGPSIIILGTILYVGFKQFQANAIKQASQLKEAWEAKTKSDDDRFNDMKDRFAASDRRHEECEKQKNEQSRQLWQLALMTGNTDVLKTKPLKDENSPDHNS